MGLIAALVVSPIKLIVGIGVLVALFATGVSQADKVAKGVQVAEALVEVWVAVVVAVANALLGALFG